MSNDLSKTKPSHIQLNALYCTVQCVVGMVEIAFKIHVHYVHYLVKETVLVMEPVMNP